MESSQATPSKILRKGRWDNNMKDTEFIQSKDPSGHWILCKICIIKSKKYGLEHKRINSRRPFNNERWIDHCSTKTHHDNIIRVSKTQKIHEFFRPIKSSSLSNGDSKIVPTATTQKQCPGIHPKHKYLKLMEIYGAYDDLDVKFIHTDDGMKAIHKKCTGKYVLALKKSVTLHSCEHCRTVHVGTKFYKRLEHMSSIKNVLDIMALPIITDDQVQQLHKFTFDYQTSNLRKKNLIEQVKNYSNYAKWFVRHKKHLSFLYPDGAASANKSTVSHVGVVGTNTLLQNFVTSYLQADLDSKDLILEGMLMSYTTKMSGKMNAKYSSTIIDLAQVIRYKSKAAYNFLHSNMLLPSIRQLQRIEAKTYNPKENILDISLPIITSRLNDFSRISHLHTSSSIDHHCQKMIVSLMYDATRVVQQVSICPRTKIIMGNIYPNQLQSFSTEIDLQKQITSPDKSQLASEIKCVMITGQNVISAQSPCKLIAARPQTTNDVCDEYTGDIMKLIQNHHNYVLLNIASDGLSSEQGIIKRQTLDYMAGNCDTVGLMDPNHCFKSCRNQLILGSAMKFVGKTIVDCGLLLLLDIPKELIIVSDFSSDTNVIRLASKQTIEKLLLLDKEENDSVAVMGLCLFFLRLFIDACNSNSMKKDRRLYSIWCAFLWFTSMKGMHPTTLKNLANSVMGLSWLVLRKDVRSIRLCTTESLEHYFGHLRTWNADFNMLEFTHFCKKLDRILHAIFNSDLNSGRGSSKGYLSGFTGYKQSIQKMLSSRRSSQASSTVQTLEENDDSAIELNYNVRAVDQLQQNVMGIINEAVLDMKVLLSNDSLLAENDSPFCRHFNTTHDLMDVYKNYNGKVGDTKETFDDTDGNDNDNEVYDLEKSNEVIISTIERIINDSLGEVDSNNDSVGSFATDVNQFNERINTTDSELVRNIKVEDISRIIHYTNNQSLKRVLSLLKGCLDENSSSAAASYIGEEKRMKSRQSRWFRVYLNENMDIKSIKRNTIVVVSGETMKVICCFKKSYNKYRMIRDINVDDDGIVFLRKLAYRSVSSSFEETDEFVKSTTKNITKIEPYVIE